MADSNREVVQVNVRLSVETRNKLAEQKRRTGKDYQEIIEGLIAAMPLANEALNHKPRKRQEVRVRDIEPGRFSRRQAVTDKKPEQLRLKQTHTGSDVE